MEKLDDYLKVIEKYYAVPKCRSCECLQVFLVQLKIDYKLKNFPNIDKMLISREKQHQCLGCDPCPPAELFAKYLKKTKRLKEYKEKEEAVIYHSDTSSIAPQTSTHNIYYS